MPMLSGISLLPGAKLFPSARNFFLHHPATALFLGERLVGFGKAVNYHVQFEVGLRREPASARRTLCLPR